MRGDGPGTVVSAVKGVLHTHTVLLGPCPVRPGPTPGADANVPAHTSAVARLTPLQQHSAVLRCKGCIEMAGFCCAARLKRTDAGPPQAQSACCTTSVWLDDALQRLAALQLLETLQALSALQCAVLCAATRSCSCQLPGQVEEQ